ncbi:hypothetical protein [Kitasatospora sp. MBT66]|uniref:hypothetical protein n=1 Tax=Kitasatospora sp. MBT66 TaxID=1444769 RepID=UPI0005BC95B4|nr:hypothetical protein [Kitasatospora sp. MBT66]
MSDVQYTSGVTVTIKAGPTQDSPWIVFHGTDPDHCFALLEEAQQNNLYAKVGDANNLFAAVEMIRRELPATVMPQNGRQGAPAPQGQQGGYSRPQAPQGAPQGGQQAPQAPPPNHDLAAVCRHGDKLYVSGISQKTGKPWFGFDCPSNFKTAECARFAKANG